MLLTCFSKVDLGNDLVNKSATLFSDRTWFTLILRRVFLLHSFNTSNIIL
ncbi:hypothetical protein RchiOBHm_Chr5g0044591 [Rosa chinensis]|uniref:Uncharacterized protein n=1 Tax=Rosa chinensis TaxID=74649 RepID=A0A2P6QDM0_ROSCH|nr:hypothetical protein RchiOBHm_Chr5g0044591 [Rosa chinensis]